MARAGSGWHRKKLDANAIARQAEYRSPQHQAARRAVKTQVDAGLAICCRCSLPIAPGSKWHLDHNDDRTGYLGPAHARCNLKAAAAKGARVANAKRSRRVTAVQM